MNSKSFVADILKTLTIVAGIALSFQIANADTGHAQTIKGNGVTLTASSPVSPLKNSVFVTPNPLISDTVHVHPSTPTPFKAPEPGPMTVCVVALGGMMLIARRKQDRSNDTIPYHMLKEYHSEFLD